MANGQWSGKWITFTIGEGELVFNGGDSRIIKNGISVYTHSKEGTTHNFQGTGPNGRALMTADVQEGDTWTVNGQPVTAYMGAEDATGSMAGSAYNGKWVSFIVEGDTLNFKGGGGLVTVEGLSAEVVLAGKTVNVKQGTKDVASVTGNAVGIGAMFLVNRIGGTTGWRGVGAISNGDASIFSESVQYVDESHLKFAYNETYRMRVYNSVYYSGGFRIKRADGTVIATALFPQSNGATVIESDPFSVEAGEIITAECYTYTAVNIMLFPVFIKQ